MRDLDDITGAIIDASLHIHRDLGGGLLESVYEAVLARTLARRRFRVERQKAIRFVYDGMAFEEGFARIWWWMTGSSWNSRAWSISHAHTPNSS